MGKHGNYALIRTTGLFFKKKICFDIMPILFCAWQKWPGGHFLLSSPWQRRQCYWLQSPEASSTTTITHSVRRISRWEVFSISQRRKIWPAVPLSFMSHPCLKERVSQERIESLNTMLLNTECNRLSWKQLVHQFGCEKGILCELMPTGPARFILLV